MIRSVEFVVPGQPVGWQRAGQNGKAHYTQWKTEKFERQLRMAYRQAVNDQLIRMDGPVKIEMNLYYQIPKSWPKKKQAAALAEKLLPYTSKPDIDNVLKCMDGLTCSRNHPVAAWNDDVQVVEAHVKKLYSDNPRTEVRITFL